MTSAQKIPASEPAQNQPVGVTEDFLKQFVPPQLRSLKDLQTDIPLIAKDEKMLRLIDEAVQRIPHRALVFVISDFITPPSAGRENFPWEHALRACAAKHDVVGIHIMDPREIELPLAASLILAGLRTATVTCVGIATIAAAVGAGGLGEFIFRGLAMVNNQLILAGAIPAAVLALSADFGLGWLEKRLRPR